MELFPHPRPHSITRMLQPRQGVGAAMWRRSGSQVGGSGCLQPIRRVGSRIADLSTSISSSVYSGGSSWDA